MIGVPVLLTTRPHLHVVPEQVDRIGPEQERQIDRLIPGISPSAEICGVFTQPLRVIFLVVFQNVNVPKLAGL